VIRTPDGDITMGFEGYSWHPHRDVVNAFSSDSPEVATARFVDDLISSRSIIAISTIAGTIRDVWITDDPAEELKYWDQSKTVEFRLWDGTKIVA
jgi:hypothetical protein